jgi:hypothetical protein
MSRSPPATRVESFTVSGYHGQPTQGTATVECFDATGRVRRAAGALGKWWGIALLSVFIPVAHFALVPSFLAYGLWQCVQRLGTVELATDARATCPDCGAAQLWDVAPRGWAPQPVTCKYCHRGLRLSPQRDSSTSVKAGDAGSDAAPPPDESAR